jgi:hypothetical protein
MDAGLHGGGRDLVVEALKAKTASNRSATVSCAASWVWTGWSERCAAAWSRAMAVPSRSKPTNVEAG